MPEPSAAIRWLLLHNLSHGWPYHSNIRLEAADAGMEWAVRKGYARDGRITDAGRVALMVGESSVDNSEFQKTKEDSNEHNN